MVRAGTRAGVVSPATTTGMTLIRGDDERRFWSRINIWGNHWTFEGWLNPKGYGQIWWQGKMRSVHRVAYELLVGPIDDGLHIDHLCRFPACVRPDHLEAVTPRENALRGISTVARQARQTHCHRGHEFTPENTRRWAGNNSRQCIACKREYDRTRRDRKAG